MQSLIRVRHKIEAVWQDHSNQMVDAMVLHHGGLMTFQVYADELTEKSIK